MHDMQLPKVGAQKPINWDRYFELAKELQQLHKKNEAMKRKIYADDADFRDE